MAFAALKICIVYYLISILENCLAWQCLNRPIVIAPLAGLVLGDFQTGIIMGAALESIFMGISSIGGALPVDATTASLIAVAFTILTGAAPEEGLTIALPIGTVMATISGITMPLFSSLAAYWEKLALECKPNKFLAQIFAVSLLVPLINTVVLFFAIAFSVEGLNAVLASMPEWVMRGLSTATSMMILVGFSILTSMIWNKEVGIYFFVGYVMVAYLHMDTLAIAIIGLAIAFALFMGEKRVIDIKNTLIKPNTSGKEDTFYINLDNIK